MKKLTLTCDAYYRNRKYHATAEDEQCNKYNVVWNVFERYGPTVDEEDDACDWDYPDEILTMYGKDVTDECFIER